MIYSVLFQKMKEKKITIDQIAQLLSCHRNSIYNRLYRKGNCDFSIKEAVQIKDEYFPEIDFDVLFEIKKGYSMSASQ